MLIDIRMRVCVLMIYIVTNVMLIVIMLGVVMLLCVLSLTVNMSILSIITPSVVRLNVVVPLNNLRNIFFFSKKAKSMTTT
jgi:hypothetical protein